MQITMTFAQAVAIKRAVQAHEAAIESFEGNVDPAVAEANRQAKMIADAFVAACGYADDGKPVSIAMEMTR